VHRGLHDSVVRVLAESSLAIVGCIELTIGAHILRLGCIYGKGGDMRSRWIVHEGERILFVDLSGFGRHPDAFREELTEVEAEVYQQLEGSLRVVRSVCPKLGTVQGMGRKDR
jgi:hypothetical protein